MATRRRTSSEKRLNGVGVYDQMERKQKKDAAVKEFKRKPYSVNKKKD